MNENPILIFSGQDYEQFVCDLVNSTDFATAEVTKQTCDQGVDVVVRLKSSGQKIAIQCKLYSSGPVGNDAVQQVVAGKALYCCESAMVVSNAVYTDSARELAVANDVLLLSHSDLKETLEYIDGGRYKIYSATLKSYLENNPLKAGYADELRFLMYSWWQCRGKVVWSVDDGLGMLLLRAMIVEAERGKRSIAACTYVMAMHAIADCYRSLETKLKRGDFGRDLAETIKEWEAMKSHSQHLILKTYLHKDIRKLFDAHEKVANLQNRLKNLFNEKHRKQLDIDNIEDSEILDICGLYRVTPKQIDDAGIVADASRNRVRDILREVFGEAYDSVFGESGCGRPSSATDNFKVAILVAMTIIVLVTMIALFIKR